jgi:CBS domain-containing protein
MDFTLEDLLPLDQQLRTVQPHETINHAIDLMFQQGYGQLPVVGTAGNFVGQVVTFESILMAIQAFKTTPEVLVVRDVTQRAEGYPADADLLRMLEHIHRDNFALIVDGSQLKGIVTAADATVFFQSFAQDLMRIESIESRLKEAIYALYSHDPDALKASIINVTDRAADIRANFPKSIKTYLAMTQAPTPILLDERAVCEAERKLGLSKPLEELSGLTLNDLIEVLLQHESAPRLSQSTNVTELRDLLHRVREVRNKLAHFRGELSAEERRVIRFANDWLENNLPVSTEHTTKKVKFDESSIPIPSDAPSDGVPETSTISDDRVEAPVGSYAKLAEALEKTPKDTSSVGFSFREIEAVLGKDLPRSAYDYRAWWANDPSKPQSVAWLDEGWRTKAISMTDQRLTFERTNDREKSYIRFFSDLKTRLSREASFPLRSISPAGLSWQNLATLDERNPDSASLVAAFARGRRFRIEIYLDYGDRQRNKSCFDFLHVSKEHLEQTLGEPLAWERLDQKRACRIAVYTRAQVSTQSDNDSLIEWAARRALEMYNVFNPYFKDALF